MVSQRTTIYEDQRAMPEFGAGTKARDEALTYGDDTYDEANAKDGSSAILRNPVVPQVLDRRGVSTRGLEYGEYQFRTTLKG